jgi:hypothetical protein
MIAGVPALCRKERQMKKVVFLTPPDVLYGFSLAGI